MVRMQPPLSRETRIPSIKVTRALKGAWEAFQLEKQRRFLKVGTVSTKGVETGKGWPGGTLGELPSSRAPLAA